MHRSRTRIVAGLAATALPLAFLAGCGEDEPKPKFEDPTSESPSTSSTPDEPEKPTPPAAMNGDDVEGAKAFVEYYFAVATYATLTGDTTTAEGLSLSDCASCQGLLKVVDRVHGRGGSVTGGVMKPKRVRLTEMQVESERIRSFAGNLTLVISEQVIRDTGVRSLDGKSPAGEVSVQIQVVHSKSGWAVVEWSQP